MRDAYITDAVRTPVGRAGGVLAEVRPDDLAALTLRALGHALGSSGSRLLTTLVHALHRRNGRYGLATMCIGVGQGIAMIVEKV
jgi:acetyl-CoA acetyltransferase